MKTNQENKAKPAALKLTERQIADFTRLAELQKEGDANGKDRKLRSVGDKWSYLQES